MSVQRRHRKAKYAAVLAALTVGSGGAVVATTGSASADTFCEGGNRIVRATETLTDIGQYWYSCSGNTALGIGWNSEVWVNSNGSITDLGGGLDCYSLAMQTDGNLVCYREGGGAGSDVYSSGTAGNNGAYLAVQADGNVVLYRADGSYLKKLN